MTNYIQRDARLIRECLPPATPIPERADTLFLIYAVLMRTKGHSTTPEDVHDAWSAWISNTDPRHAAAIPFNRLSDEKQREDLPFLQAIHLAAKRANEMD